MGLFKGRRAGGEGGFGEFVKVGIVNRSLFTVATSNKHSLIVKPQGSTAEEQG